MTVEAISSAALPLPSSADVAATDIEAPVEPTDVLDSFALDEAHEREGADTAEPRQPLMPAVLRLSPAIKREIFHPLLKGVGPKFDEAIIETARLGTTEAKSIFQRAIFTLAHSLHTGDGSGIKPADSLQDYLVRLRIVRLMEAMEGRLDSMWIYPFSGFDLLPSLFASRVMGIDYKIEETNLPAYSGDPRDTFIIDGADPRFEKEQNYLFRMLKSFLGSAARHPGRHIALNHDVFSTIMTQTLLLSEGRNRLLFLKGTQWMDLPPTGCRDDSDIARRALVTKCTKPGELVAVWDCNPQLDSFLVQSGLCEQVPPNFLPDDLALRVAGKGISEGKIVVSVGSTAYEGKICFMIPEALRLFRNRG
ncbi:MAG: hypothetical protein WC956_01935 [bacterium]